MQVAGEELHERGGGGLAFAQARVDTSLRGPKKPEFSRVLLGSGEKSCAWARAVCPALAGDPDGSRRGARKVRQLHRSVPAICGLVAIVTSLMVIVGWIFDSAAVVRLGTGTSSMKVNTAVCLALLGLALVQWQRGHGGAYVGLSCAAAVVATVTLAEYITGLDLRIDTLLLGSRQRALDSQLDHPGRMAAVTGVAILLLGVAPLVRRRSGLFQALAYAASFIGYVAALVIVYSGGTSRHVIGLSSVALHTAVALLLLAIGALWTLPDNGLIGIVRTRGPVGQISRRMAAFGVVLPPLTGFVLLAAARNELDDAFLRGAVTTLVWTVGGLLAVTLAAREALPMERALDEAVSSARAARERLDTAIEVSGFFSSSLDPREVLERATIKVAETLKDACSIRLVDDDGSMMRAVTLHHVDPARRLLLWETFGRRPNRTDEGMSGRVVQTRLPMLLTTIDPQLVQGMDAVIRENVERSGVRSAIFAPLMSHGRVLGSIAVFRDLTSTPYDDDDVALLTDIADRGAEAIHLARVVASKGRADAALTQLAAQTLTVRDGEQLQRQAVALVARSLPASYAWLLSAAHGPLSVVAVACPPGDEPALSLAEPILRGVPPQVLATGEPVLCDDMRHDSSTAMHDLGELLGTDSGVVVPLTGREGSWGVLAVASPGVARHTTDDVTFLVAFAGLLATALDRLVADEELQRANSYREALLTRLVSAQDEERRRIADGVHDDQVQSLAALLLRLGLLRNRLSIVAPELLPELDRSREAVTRATERLRDLLFDLSLPGPDSDLAASLREAATRIFEDVPATSWDVQVPAGVDLDTGQAVIAYSIAKEAMTNTRRHASASTVTVTTSMSSHDWQLCVSDDGEGMSPTITRSPHGHRGLSSMHDRAALAGGWLRVDTRRGGGTTVTFGLPVRGQPPSLRAPDVVDRSDLDTPGGT